MRPGDKNVSQETELKALDFLDKKATQVGFAELVGVTQPAISKHIGRSLKKGESYRQWLLAYCEHMRNEAAGRGGDAQARLTVSRINESDTKAALNRLTYNEKVGTLIQSAEAERVLTEWAGYAVREFEKSFFSLISEIELIYNTKIDSNLTQRITEMPLKRIASYAEKLGKGLASSG